MLSTPWSRAMGLRVPIVNAPMGGVAGGRLAAGVSAAGGLGMVGMGTAGSTSSLHAELPHVTGTFGIGLVDWVMRKEVGLFEAAVAAAAGCMVGLPGGHNFLRGDSLFRRHASAPVREWS